ncbi:MAG: hypothetical protein M1836_002875 [Candelina mexicana]|nr:MAG: hypothetical protein M1836_002875 [Candelina mexicana]
MSQKHMSPLLRIPPEIRIMIFDLLLTPLKIAGATGLPDHPCMIQPDYEEFVFSEHDFFSILRVSRQIHREALPILYGNNSFLLISHAAGLFLAKINTIALRSLSKVVFWYAEDTIGDGFKPLADARSLTKLDVHIFFRQMRDDHSSLWNFRGMDDLRNAVVARPVLSTQNEMTDFANGMKAIMEKPKREMREQQE